MKAVLLAGGFGTRLSEETDLLPKPMVEIGGRPILWHIMKIYTHFGINDFIICLGYNGYVIKEYFINYYRHMSDLSVDTGSGDIEIHQARTEKWRVTLVETGLDTMTGGRLKRISKYLSPNEDFLMTYGDGVASINIQALIEFHRNEGRLATVTAVRPPGRFGALEIEDNRVERFTEKPQGDGSIINGGFFVLSPKVLDYVEGDATIWESEPMERLAREGELSAYRHSGFWQPMDTLRDRRELEQMWVSGNAEWKLW
jgi:glucose-1-phosphate cytidylyltransferase